jgi:methionine-R-sulfoxide reductase
MKQVPLFVFNREGKLVGPLQLPRVEKTDLEWQEQLTPEQFAVARAHGTERPFCGTLLDNKRAGVYSCICCGLPLFASNAKFDSGTGWPSFFQPIADENVATRPDRGFGMLRVEILCARCDCHLGHVFPDGPPPTRQRHCVNSESLTFTDVDQLASLADPAACT